MKLKTLKDLKTWKKAEAIKWVKEAEIKRKELFNEEIEEITDITKEGVKVYHKLSKNDLDYFMLGERIKLIKHFFNITKEEIDKLSGFNNDNEREEER